MIQQQENTELNSNEEASSCCSNDSCCGPKEPMVRQGAKVGRNDPCPCGSGVKHKKCCGR